MLDRAALVSALRTRALAYNAIPLHVAGRIPIERHEGTWLIGAQHDASARFIVDASGRAGAVVRRLGIRRVTDGRQIALVSALQVRRGRDEAPLMVEAVADGWWYSAATSAGETVVAFFTDHDLIDLSASRKSAKFAALLGRTHADPPRTNFLVPHQSIALI
jgi:flavin-dependent dehydrogenase